MQRLPVVVSSRQLPGTHVRPARPRAIGELELVDQLQGRVLVVQEREVAGQEHVDAVSEALRRALAGPTSSSTPSNSGLPGPSRKNWPGVTSISDESREFRIVRRDLRGNAGRSFPPARAGSDAARSTPARRRDRYRTGCATAEDRDAFMVARRRSFCRSTAQWDLLSSRSPATRPSERICNSQAIDAASTSAQDQPADRAQPRRGISRSLTPSVQLLELRHYLRRGLAASSRVEPGYCSSTLRRKRA